jgi:hypothetical protein
MTLRKFDFWKRRKASSVPVTFGSWKGQHFELSVTEFTDQLRSWLFTKELSWLSRQRPDLIVQAFMKDHDGLGAVCETAQAKEIMEVGLEAVMTDLVNAAAIVKLFKPITQKRFKDCDIWQIGIRKVLRENAGIMALLTSLRGQQKDNPQVMDQIVGLEAAEILKTFPFPPAVRPGVNLGQYDLKKLS